MAEYGMKPLDVLKSATSVNADVFKIVHEKSRGRNGTEYSFSPESPKVLRPSVTGT